jgi:hypothetical protein
MDLALSLGFLALGLAALAYDSNIADALNSFPYLTNELIHQRDFGWKRVEVLPPSRKGFETYLRFIRFWGILMVVGGFLNSIFCFSIDI